MPTTSPLAGYADDMDYPLPGYAAIIMKQTEVRAGDVLLGYAGITAGESQAQPLGYSLGSLSPIEYRVSLGLAT